MNGLKSKMTEDEFRSALKKAGISGISEALIILERNTGVNIHHSAISTHILRYGALSKAHTAMFRLLFDKLGVTANV